MTNLIIDPYVFACPHPDEGIEIFRQYLKSIISWRELNEQKWARVLISTETVDLLLESNRYPLWEGLKAAIANFQIQDVQPKDIVNLVDALLQKLPTLEDDAKITDLLFDQNSSIPDYHLTPREPRFIEQYFRIALMMCLAAELNGRNDISQLLVTRLLNEDIVSSELHAVIHDCETTDDLTVGPLPIHLHSQLDLCNTPHGLYLTVDPLQIWVEAETDEVRAQALHVFIYKKVFESRRERITEEDHLWTFGPTFCASVMAKGFLNNQARMRSLLRACSEIILGEQLAQTRHLREGAGAEDPQIKRGPDRAWRRNIDREYRIHYWETARGPEFACVANHNEFDIP